MRMLHVDVCAHYVRARLKCDCILRLGWHAHCFKLRALTAGLPGVWWSVSRGRYVCEWVGGCVRIDPLRDPDRILPNGWPTFWTTPSPGICAVIGWTAASLLRIIFMPTPCENYLIVCLNVWANIGQLIWVGFWWWLRKCSCIKRLSCIWYRKQTRNVLRIICSDHHGVAFLQMH